MAFAQAGSLSSGSGLKVIVKRTFLDLAPSAEDELECVDSLDCRARAFTDSFIEYKGDNAYAFKLESDVITTVFEDQHEANFAPCKPPGVMCGPPGVWSAGSDTASTMSPSMTYATSPEASECTSLSGFDFEEQEMTTLMIRKLPKTLTRAMMLGVLDGEGYHGLYDFVYVPRDLRTLVGFSYAFVNFICHEHAVAAMQLFEGFAAWPVPSNKKATPVWSTIDQGWNAQVERHRNTQVMHPDVPEDLKPLVLIDGEPASFPQPTAEIQLPSRLRSKA